MRDRLYRGALIGCGYASGLQLRAWSEIKGAGIVAVSSRNREKAQRRAEEFSIASCYVDYREMMDSEDLDFVDIAAPPAAHLEMVSEASQRGLQVLCQKPVASSMDELHEMIRLCEEANVRFMVNENGRFQPWFRKIRALLDEGGVGEPFYASFVSRARLTLPILSAGGQEELFAKMPRLVLFELGVHHFDTLRYLFGEASRLCAQVKRVSPHVEGDDVSLILSRFGSVDVVVDLSWASIPHWRNEGGVTWGDYRIEGYEGTMHLMPDGLLRIIRDDATYEISFPKDGELAGYRAAQQHFVECLNTGAEFETSGPETLKTMELVFAAYQSAVEERPIAVGRG